MERERREREGKEWGRYRGKIGDRERTRRGEKGIE